MIFTCHVHAVLALSNALPIGCIGLLLPEVAMFVGIKCPMSQYFLFRLQISQADLVRSLQVV